MPDYNLGKAHGTVRVDYDGRGVQAADDDLRKLGQTSEETGQKVSASSGQMTTEQRNLAQSVKQLTDEMARAAVREISAKARLHAAEQQLASARSSATATAKQLADAERLVQAEHQRVVGAAVKVQQAEAALLAVRQRLNALPAPRPIVGSGDGGRLADVVHHLQNIDKNSRRAVFGLNAFSGRLILLVKGAALAAPTLAGVAVSLADLTGLVGPAAGALVGLIAVVGTLITAFSGVGEVFKQAGQNAAGAGQDARQAAQQQRAAAQQIQQALRGIRDAQEEVDRARQDAARIARQSVQQIILAERGLRDAQAAALRAQEGLTRARREAVRQLEDMRSALVGGALDERQAILDVERAQAELTETLNDPRAKDLDRRQAQLTLERQQRALERIGVENQRLVADQAEAARAGVAGSQIVQSAQEEVLHSTEAVGDAALAVSDTLAEGARQQIEAQRAIRDAIEGLADAHEDLIDAQLNSAEVGTGASVALADAMAKVSPEAREVIRAILDQGKAWQEVKFAVQDAFFDDLAEQIAPLANTWLPLLKHGMVGIAGELNGLVKDIISFMMEARTTDDVRTIFDNIRLALHNVRPAIVNILRVFFDLATVGSSLLPQLAEGFSNVTGQLVRVSAESRESGRMREWMEQALATSRQLFTLLGNIFSIIGIIFSAFDQQGGGALNTLVMLTGKLEDFLRSAQGQEILHALGSTLAALGVLFGKVLIGALTAFGAAFVPLAPLIQEVASILGDQLLATLMLLAPILNIIAEVLGFLSPILAPLIASMILLNKLVAIATALWRVLNLVMKANVFLLIAAAVIALVTLIILHWDKIVSFLSDTWTALETLAREVWERIESWIIDPIKRAIAAVIALFKDVIEGAKFIFSQFIELTKRAWENIERWIIDPVRNAVTSVLNFFRDLQLKIGEIFRDAKNWLFNTGRDIILGLWEGIQNLLGWLWDRINDIGRGIADAFSSVLDIFSPSKVFAKFGEFTMEGYLIGLDNLEPAVIQRVVDIAGTITAAGEPAPPLIPLPRLSAAPGATAPERSAPTTIVVEHLTLQITGNLDPTNPTAWRAAMNNIKTGIETVDKERR